MRGDMQCNGYNNVPFVTKIMKGDNFMEIIEYDEKYKQAFIDFNTEWIIKYFGFLEEEDVYTFEHIEELLEKGSMVFFAVEDGVPLAACMAEPMEGGTWELCKLGSNSSAPHKGVGEAVARAAMDWAKAHGAERMFIITNTVLKAAIHIYEKLGFREIKLDDYGYKRGDIAFECILE